MQRLELVYQNGISLYKTEKGWCLLCYRNNTAPEKLWENGNCIVFYPESFVPDEEFGRKLERLCQKQEIRLLWIENPETILEFWKITSVASGNFIVYMGKYWLQLKEFYGETDEKLSFYGRFGVNNNVFFPEDMSISLSLNDTYGELSFAFSANSKNFSVLDVGIQYLKPLSEEIKEGWKENYMEKIQAFLIEPEKEECISARITPVFMGEKQHTFFLLPDSTWKSTFLSPEGKIIKIKSSSTKLVFEKTAKVIKKKADNSGYFVWGLSWYLGIDGEFSIENQEPVMLGLAGTEYIANVKCLKFIAGQNAIQDKRDILQEDSVYPITTPWIAFQGDYYSSSISMPFFAAEDNYLRAYGTKVESYEENFSMPVPVIPWGGVEKISNTVHIERQENMLAERRYQILTAGIKLIKDENKAENIIVTPSGLCVAVETNSGNWNWIGIVQTKESGLPNVHLVSPAPETRKILQKSESVLIASDYQGFQTLSNDDLKLEFEVDGWNILLSKEVWTENSLFMMKYSKTESVRDLLKETPQLQRILERTYDTNGNVKKGFEAFLDIIEEKEFQGILMLGAAVQMHSLSPELKNILKWGSGGDFQVPYVVIKSGKTIVKGSDISVAKSKVDALVLYEGVPQNSINSCSFDFCTRDLIVILEQSKVKFFQSHSELAIYELFGAKLAPANELSGNHLMLSGRIENVNGIETYKFSVDSKASYKVQNSVLETIEIHDVLVSGGKEKINFLLSGFMSFLKIEEFDLFSYDQIEFNGLIFVKDLEQKNVEYDGIQLYGENAVVREGSFVKAFGAKICDVFWKEINEFPDDMGYWAVNTPLQQEKLTNNWNGIVWQISLNSSGKLGKDSPLGIYIMAGWNERNYYVGIKTDGIFGQTFSIQGILTAGFTGVSVEMGPDGKMYLKLYSFVIKTLGFSLPPKGVDVYVLGQNGNIAWCATYEG